MYNSIVDLKKKAREQLTNYWRMSVVASAIYLVILIIFNELVSEKAYIYTIIKDLILVFFSLGLTAFFINVNKNKAKIVDIFSQSKTYIRGIFISMLLTLPTMISTLILGDFLRHYMMKSNPNESILIITSLSIVVFLILSVLFNLMFALSSIIVVDKQNISLIDALKESSKLMKGQKIKFIVMYVSFIGWLIASVLTFGVGFLFLLPYIQLTLINFYLELKEKKK